MLMIKKEAEKILLRKKILMLMIKIFGKKLDFHLMGLMLNNCLGNFVVKRMKYVHLEKLNQNL